MNFKEKFGAVGVLNLKVIENGTVVETFQEKNLIVNGGRAAIAELIGAATSGKAVNTIGFGTGATLPELTDTALTGQFTKPVGFVSYPANETVQFDFTLEVGENNGVTIREFGLFCADGTLFSRKVRAAIEKTSAIRLEGFWTIQF